MQSVLKQSFRDLQVYLVDNGSSGEDFSILQKKFAADARVHLIQNRENLGFTRGNNRILEQILSRTSPPPYIALLNNDTQVEPNWLENLLRCAQEAKADIVTSKMIQYYQRDCMDNAGHFMLNTAEIIPLGHGEPVEKFNERFENFGSCAGATLYSTSMLREIGLFDEYFDTGYEDAELGARAIVLGYRSVFEPSAIVYHKISRSVTKVMDYSYLLRIQLNIFYSYFKLMPPIVLWANLPSLFFKYGSIILIDILFFRWKFLRIMSEAICRSFFRERKTIRKARKAFFRKHAPISSLAILQKQTFFLWFDIRRFVKYILLRKPTQFER
jgi:GT2 family glycosyltransferase